MNKITKGIIYAAFSAYLGIMGGCSKNNPAAVKTPEELLAEKTTPEQPPLTKEEAIEVMVKTAEGLGYTKSLFAYEPFTYVKDFTLRLNQDNRDKIKVDLLFNDSTKYIGAIYVPENDDEATIDSMVKAAEEVYMPIVKIPPTEYENRIAYLIDSVLARD